MKRSSKGRLQSGRKPSDSDFDVPKERNRANKGTVVQSDKTKVSRTPTRLNQYVMSSIGLLGRTTLIGHDER
eukprot:4553287-Amphidinium_carterae.1